MQKIIQRIEKEDLSVLENQEVDCFLLSSKLSEKFIKDFTTKAQTLEKIALVYGENSIQKCLETNCDGVIIDLTASENIKKDIEKIRKELGDKKFLGIIPRARRHEAMLVSELEPDFVVFKVWKDGIENMQELVSWYTEFFLIQCAILLEEDVDVSSFSADMVIK